LGIDLACLLGSSGPLRDRFARQQDLFACIWFGFALLLEPMGQPIVGFALPLGLIGSKVWAVDAHKVAEDVSLFAVDAGWWLFWPADPGVDACLGAVDEGWSTVRVGKCTEGWPVLGKVHGGKVHSVPS